jgi:hypothetical protein
MAKEMCCWMWNFLRKFHSLQHPKNYYIFMSFNDGKGWIFYELKAPVFYCFFFACILGRHNTLSTAIIVKIVLEMFNVLCQFFHLFWRRCISWSCWINSTFFPFSWKPDWDWEFLRNFKSCKILTRHDYNHKCQKKILQWHLIFCDFCDFSFICKNSMLNIILLKV